MNDSTPSLLGFFDRVSQQSKYYTGFLTIREVSLAKHCAADLLSLRAYCHTSFNEA